MNPRSTKDYSIFKNHESNREIDKNNLKKIISSIQCRNLLEHRPIIVNSKFEIIDGQHRFEASKILGIEIWYVIKEDSVHEDIILLNVNQKQWDLEDYLHYHISFNKKDYIDLYNFIKDESINIRQALRFMSLTSKHGVLSFKTGSFSFPTGNVYIKMMEDLYKFKSIVQMILLMKINSSTMCATSSFKKGLLEFLNIEELDFDTFKEKISMNMEKVHKCSNSSEYLNMLKEIYNWKNKNPLP